MKSQIQSPKRGVSVPLWASGFGHSFGFLVSGFGFAPDLFPWRYPDVQRL
jgi:hypothetical protein